MPYRLLVCGSNGSYQLGLENDDDHSTLQSIDLPALASMKPQAFAFGGNHTLVLFPDGRVFAAGNNEFGQCGIPNSESLQSFTELSGRWLEIAAGWEFSLLRSVDGHIYSCGHGPRGELGHGKETKICRELRKIDLSQVLSNLSHESSSIHLMKASLNHVVIQLKNGTFIGWGACKKGQLGHIDPIDDNAERLKYPLALWNPKILDLPSGPFFVVGKEKTVIYNEVGKIMNLVSLKQLLEDQSLSESGPSLAAFSCGTNKLSANPDDFSSSELNSEDEFKSEFLEESSINISSSTKIQCGWSSIHILKDGALHSYGKNTHGQLYNQSVCQDSILDFAIGSEHGVILTNNQTVYAWGWGEHGNCGLGEDPFDHNEIYKGNKKEKAVGLACGLATTWIVVEELDQTDFSTNLL